MMGRDGGEGGKERGECLTGDEGAVGGVWGGGEGGAGAA